MSEPMICGARTFRLARWPVQRDDPLRAWDTADQYLLEAVADRPGRLLVFNDRFGALTVPLAGRAPTVWSDSHLTRLALAANLEANGQEIDACVFVPASETPAGPFDLVIARFPKSLAFWEDSLLRLRPLLAPAAAVIAGGMIKHTPRRAFELMERIVGPTRTSEGWKKARLAEATLAARDGLPDRVPDTTYALDGHPVTLDNGPNVFARDHLDVGTRTLLPLLPSGGLGAMVDLGCGNGALAIALARRNPQATVLGVDESYQAVASARANAARAGLEAPRVTFTVADGLSELADASVDLVVTNPPFHQDRNVGDAVAWAMFREAARTLIIGGRLLVVGNRHLAHGRRLVRLFGAVDVLAELGKFEVLLTERRA